MSNDARNARTTAAILDAAAHALSEHGRSANMADVAEAAGISRATLYRYYPDREALLDALAAQALADAGSRLADAGLERAPVEEAIERIVRALTAVGDRYAVLVREQVEADPDEIERLVAAPMRAVFARGIESGLLRLPGRCPRTMTRAFLRRTQSGRQYEVTRVRLSAWQKIGSRACARW